MSQQEIVNNHIKPWLPVAMIVIGAITITRLAFDSHTEAQEPPAVKIEKEKTKQAFFEANKRKYDAEIAKAEARKNQPPIIVPSPFSQVQQRPQQWPYQP
ncbi:MAG: hypothetical protein KBC50_02795 [Candidatus Pacebacteria bacterium]|nr:hypothetical protein [Candidatus Paceibacterota bacterium]